MYKRLSKEETEEFIKKYFNIWNGDIKSVSCVEYCNVKEYLINEHYFYIVK